MFSKWILTAYKRQGKMDFLKSYFYTDTLIGHKQLLLIMLN